MQPDFFAVPIEQRPAGLDDQPETQVGPTGQVFRVWRRGGQQYLSVLVGGNESWFLLAATSGRRRPRCN